jgi:superfamily II helicase
VLICVALLSGVDFSGSVILLVTIIIGGLNWLAVRK